MACVINIEQLSYPIREKINKELEIKIETNNKYGPPYKFFYPYEIVDNDIFLPFAYAYNSLNLRRPNRDIFSVMCTPFSGVLRPEQITVKKEALTLLNNTGSVIISLYTGCGKTITSISLACTIRLKTLVIVNKIVLIKQWNEAILKVCPTAKVQLLTSKSHLEEDADFYIMNAINISKMPRSFYRDMGLCIVDELHLIMADTISKSLLYINPRYLIGLSATPYRLDGFDPLIDIYFGKNKIVRELHREHIIYKVQTDIKIDLELNENGTVNWGAVLQAQSGNVERNEIILKIIKKFNDKIFLILCKRVEQGQYLYDTLQKSGECVDNLIGSKQDFDPNCRILVATISKASTGFDWPTANALIVGCDTDAYFIQTLGRVFRSLNTTPIVFDLIDNNPILFRHYKNREEVYKKSGGVIKKFNLDLI